ncbi:MAG: ABC transporter permease [Anaerolineales bacterium]
MTALRRRTRAYAAIAAMMPKVFMAYNTWFWVEFFVQILYMTVFVFFWRAVYADQATIAGLNLRATLNYVLLAQVMVPLVENDLILQFGGLLHQGQIVVELLRPLDFQEQQYLQSVALSATNLLMKLPLLLIGWLLFGLRIPADPRVWGAFLVALVLGHAVLFCFDWILACLTFYTTEAWGLHVVRSGVALFASGALIPLRIMPDGVERMVRLLPFAQALDVPISLLSGVTPVAEAPRLWLGQLAWLLGLFVTSRLIFHLAVRKVTVQGG